MLNRTGTRFVLLFYKEFERMNVCVLNIYYADTILVCAEALWLPQGCHPWAQTLEER